MRRVTVLRSVLLGFVLSFLAGCSEDENPVVIVPPPPPPVDTKLPSPVTDLVLACAPNSETVTMSWTAPSDDSISEPVARYDIRFEYTTGFEPLRFWQTSSVIADPPAPADPGTPQEYTLANPRRARDLYVGIRTFDEAGNHSATVRPEMVHVPGLTFRAVCVDALTGLPVEGLAVALSTGETWLYTTDSSGGFAHGEIDYGVTHVEIHTGTAPTAYHAIDQSFVLEADSAHTFYMIPVEPVDAVWAPNLLGLFNRLVTTVPYNPAAATTDPSSRPAVGAETPSSAPIPRILAQWRRRPVKCYIPPFVNDDGVDYEEQGRLAAMRWMERTGIPLFTFVDAPPDTGIILEYKPRSEMGGGIAFTAHHPDAEGHPVRDVIRIVSEMPDPFSTYKILLHELGHTLPLGHTDDPTFIMYLGQPLPDDISEDEARVVQLLAALPVRIDMAVYDENASAQGGSPRPKAPRDPVRRAPIDDPATSATR